MDEKDKELACTIGDEFSFHQIHSSMGILSSRINDFSSEYISSRILLVNKNKHNKFIFLFSTFLGDKLHRGTNLSTMA
jgi:hypothetical protein